MAGRLETGPLHLRLRDGYRAQCGDDALGDLRFSRALRIVAALGAVAVAQAQVQRPGFEPAGHVEDGAAPGQRMVGLVQVGVVADEELADVAFEPLPGELRGGLGAGQFGHQVAHLQAHRGQRGEQAPGLVGGLVERAAVGVFFHHLAQQQFDRAHLGRDEGGSVLAELHQRGQQLGHQRHHRDHLARADAVLAQPAGIAEAFVDGGRAQVQGHVRRVAVLVLPRVVHQQVALDRGDDLAARQAVQGRDRRIRAEELVEQPAQQLPVVLAVGRGQRAEQTRRHAREQRCP